MFKFFGIFVLVAALLGIGFYYLTLASDGGEVGWVGMQYEERIIGTSLLLLVVGLVLCGISKSED